MSRVHYTVEHCAIVVLAAGTSSRLGSPKQLLAYKGRSLVQHAVDMALQTSMRPVVVVVGAYSHLVKKEIEGMGAEVVYHSAWQEGMASSLRCGLAFVQQSDAGIDGIIFMVCDQPHVTGPLLENLLTVQRETGLPIVASRYNDQVGTPVLWHKTFFDKLMGLKGDIGARKLIKKYEDLVATADFPKGIIDIDTGKDYENLLQ